MSRTTGVRMTAALLRITGAVLLFAASCATPPHRRYENSLAQSEDAALHAVHDHRLRELMTAMSDIALERMPQELERDAADKVRQRDIARVAASLAQASLYIPAVLDRVRMGSEDRRVFEALAAALHDEAAALAELAEQANLPRMRTQLDKIITTCHNCHNSFRILPVVEPPREVGSVRRSSASLRLWVEVTGVDAGTPQGNDIFVSINSAQGPAAFRNLVSSEIVYDFPGGKDHVSVTDAEVGADIIPLIQSAELAHGDFRPFLWCQP